MGPKEAELAKIKHAAANISGQAQQWEDAATEIDNLITSIKSTKNDLGVDWEGDGASAAYTAMDTLTQSLGVHAQALRKVKVSLETANTAVSTAQSALSDKVQTVDTSPDRTAFVRQEGLDGEGPIKKKFDQESYDSAVAAQEQERERAAEVALRQLRIDMSTATATLPVEAPDKYSNDDTSLPPGGGGTPAGGGGSNPTGYSGGHTGAVPTIGGNPGFHPDPVPGYDPGDPTLPTVITDGPIGDPGIDPTTYSTSVDGVVTGTIPGVTGVSGTDGSSGTSGFGGIAGAVGGVGMVAGGAGAGGMLRGAGGGLGKLTGAARGAASGAAGGAFGGTSGMPGGTAGGATNVVAGGQAGGRGGMVPGGGGSGGMGGSSSSVKGASASGKYGVPRLDGAGGKGGSTMVGGGSSAQGAGGRGSRSGGSANAMGAGGAGGAGSGKDGKKDKDFLTHEDEENWYDDTEASDSVWE